MIYNFIAIFLDVERFLTEVLGKLSNLPDNVNKERLELSQRLQKFLNLPHGKEASKKKLPPPIPTEPANEGVVEVCGLFAVNVSNFFIEILRKQVL